MSKEQKSGTQGDSWVCNWCSYHILTSSVIYYWTDTWQHGVYVFYNNETSYYLQIKLFFLSKSLNVLESRSLPTLVNMEKAIWCNHCLYKIKQSDWLLCKKMWLVQEIHATVKLAQASLLIEWKLTVKAELNCKIYKPKENARKVKSVVVTRAALLAGKLGRCLEHCKSCKMPLENLRL